MKSKRVVVFLVAILALALPLLAGAQDTGWTLRLRAVDLYPNSSSNVVTGNGVNSFSRIHFEDKWAPELDVTYKWAKNWGVELSLTSARHQVDFVSGLLNDESMGSVNIMPLTVTCQYYFTTSSRFQPYVGLGLNYTQISSFDASSYLKGLGVSADFDNSWGVTAQIGADVFIDKHWLINFDIKYSWVGTYVNFNQAGSYYPKVDATIDPTIWGIGFGYRW